MLTVTSHLSVMDVLGTGEMPMITFVVAGAALDGCLGVLSRLLLTHSGQIVQKQTRMPRSKGAKVSLICA